MVPFLNFNSHVNNSCGSDSDSQDSEILKLFNERIDSLSFSLGIDLLFI